MWGGVEGDDVHGELLPYYLPIFPAVPCFLLFKVTDQKNSSEVCFLSMMGQCAQSAISTLRFPLVDNHDTVVQ